MRVTRLPWGFCQLVLNKNDFRLTKTVNLAEKQLCKMIFRF